MDRFTEDVLARAARVNCLLLDVDGVMTDGTIYLDDRGVESKGFNIMDGLGLNLLKKHGIARAIITGRKSGVVAVRAAELAIEHVVQGCADKTAAAEQLAGELGLTMDQMGFVGDDLIDLKLLSRVGLAVAVPGAAPEVREVVHYVTRATGGNGAVREVCELLLKARGVWEETVGDYQ